MDWALFYHSWNGGASCRGIHRGRDVDGQIAFSSESAILSTCKASLSPALTDLPGARSGSSPASRRNDWHAGREREAQHLGGMI